MLTPALLHTRHFVHNRSAANDVVHNTGCVVLIVTDFPVISLEVLINPPNFISSPFKFHFKPVVDTCSAPPPTGIIPQVGPSKFKSGISSVVPAPTNCILFAANSILFAANGIVFAANYILFAANGI